MSSRTASASGAQAAAPEPDPLADGCPLCAAAIRRSAEVSSRPRWADVAQLEWIYLMHRQECVDCTYQGPCTMARRLEEACGTARRNAEATS